MCYSTFLFLALLVAACAANAQPCRDNALSLRGEIPSTCFEMTMTMKHDNRPGYSYLYVANKEAGLKIYNVSAMDAPVLVATVPIAALQGLHVMNLEQVGNRLYLALGNHFGASQSPGLAIIDIATPSSTQLLGVWQHGASDGGAGIVKVAGNHAL